MRAMTMQQQLEQWNARNPIGTPVTVRRDNGECMTTITRSAAWKLSQGRAVVLVDGITGGYSLERVNPIDLAALARHGVRCG